MPLYMVFQESEVAEPVNETFIHYHPERMWIYVQLQGMHQKNLHHPLQLRKTLIYWFKTMNIWNSVSSPIFKPLKETFFTEGGNWISRQETLIGFNLEIPRAVRSTASLQRRSPASNTGAMVLLCQNITQEPRITCTSLFLGLLSSDDNWINGSWALLRPLGSLCHGPFQQHRKGLGGEGTARVWNVDRRIHISCTSAKIPLQGGKSQMLQSSCSFNIPGGTHSWGFLNGGFLPRQNTAMGWLFPGKPWMLLTLMAQDIPCKHCQHQWQDEVSTDKRWPKQHSAPLPSCSVTALLILGAAHLRKQCQEELSVLQTW